MFVISFSLFFIYLIDDFQIPDNEDGTQWFHLLNEEFTEKLLQGLMKDIMFSDRWMSFFSIELVEEFRTIFMKKSSQKYQERFEQLRLQKVKLPSQSIKPKSSSSTFFRRNLFFIIFYRLWTNSFGWYWSISSSHSFNKWFSEKYNIFFIIIDSRSTAIELLWTG